jgi:MFS family permease
MFMTKGSAGTLGVFLVPIANETGLALPQLMVAVSITTAASAVTALIAPTIIARISPKWALRAGTVLMALNFALASFTQTVWPLYIGTLLSGIAVAIGTNAAAGALIGQWFIDKRTHITGLVFGGTTFGAALFTIISGILIEASGFRLAYIVMAVAVLVVGILVNLLLIRTPEQLGQKPLGWEKEEEMKAAATNVGQNLEGLTAREARRTPSYWLMFLALALFGGGSVLFAMNINTFVVTMHGYSVSQGSYLASISMVGAALLAMGTGMILARLKLRPFICVCVGGMIAANLIFAFAPTLPFALGAVAVIFSVFCNPILGPLIATYCMDGFGNREFGKIMGFMIAAVMVGSVIAPLLSSFLLKITGSFVPMYIAAIVLVLLATTLLLTALGASPFAKAQKIIAAQKAESAM